MVVDDAVVARSLLRGWIDAEPDMKVVAALRTGRQAVDAMEFRRCRCCSRRSAASW
jgi:two-component system chemotaxis response regulator CheB